MRVQFSQKAFTFIELLILVAIISLLLVITDANLFSLLEKQSTQSATQQFFADLQFARSEAIKRNLPVHICPSIDGQQCTAKWQNTYIIFLINDDAAHDNKDILRVNRFSNNLSVTHSNHPLITFRGDGSCLTRITLWMQNGASAQKVVIYDSGRARIALAA